MMQKKKLKLLLAGFAASTILFTAPLPVAIVASATATTPTTPDDPDAGPGYDLSKVKDAIDINTNCYSNGKCPGHKIMQSETGSHTIVVNGGTHDIYFENTITIEGRDDAPPIEIKNGTANLHLNEGCNVTLDNSAKTKGAGLQVQNSGKLFILGSGNLIAKGGAYSAGIGGHDAAVGAITISGGTIRAEGGGGAAGIGSGYRGKCTSITINNNAKVTALGGDHKDYAAAGGSVTENREAGPGIGQVGSSGGGTITISGGTVGALGGNRKDGGRTSGFVGNTLESVDGSGNIFTNDSSLGGIPEGGKSRINAIVWEISDETQIGKTTGTSNAPIEGVVWGNGSIGQRVSEAKLTLRRGSTLTVTKNPTEFENTAIISIDGDEGRTNAIYNGNYITGSPIIPKNIKEYVGVSDDCVDVVERQNYTAKDETDNLIHIKDTIYKDKDDPSQGIYYVDKDQWDLFLKKDTSTDFVSHTEMPIRGCGVYTIKYRHKKYNYSGNDEKDKYDGEVILTKNVTVVPADITECTFKVEPLTYTGKEVKPNLSVIFNQQTIEKPENEFVIEWGKGFVAGKYTATIHALGEGNFDGDTTVDYVIEGAHLEEVAEMTVAPETNEYTGTKQEPVVTVKLKDGNETLKPDEDYTLTYSGGDSTNFTNAGDITCTITGMEGSNYQGEITKPYKITQKEIAIKSGSIVAKSKEYTGDGEVTIEDVEFDGVVDADKGKLRLKSKGIVDANNEGHAGKYSSIHFDGDIELEYEDADGNRTPCTNYILTYNGEEIPLKEDVTIEKATPTLGERKLTHVDPYAVNANGLTFDCTVEFERQRGITYQFKMDGDPESEEGWTSEVNPKDTDKASAVFRGINPATSNEDKHVFYVRSEGTDDVEQVLLDKHEVVFKKLPNPKTVQNKPTISYNEEGNPDKKTYTVTIDKLEDSDIEYRIIVPGKEDGVEFGNSNVEPLADPGTTYVGQVRYKETEVYEASEPVSSDEIKTPASPLANSGPKYKTTWKRIIPNQSDGIAVPPGLQEVDYTSMQEVTADLTRYLSQLGAYQDSEHTAFYDVKVQVITRDESGKSITRDALPGDFENGGISVTLPSKMLPQGVTATENQFSVVHMFETDDYAEYSAGDIEICADSEGSDVFLGSGKGVTFTMNGASPVGIAWSEAPEDPGTTDPEDPGTTDPGTTDPGTTDPGTTDPGTTDPGATDPTQQAQVQDPLSDAGNQTQNGNNNQTGNTDGNSNGTDSQNQDSKSIADALKSAVSSLAPKTGDTSKLIMWAVIAAAACIAVIVAIRSKMKSGKKGKTTAQKTNVAASKTGSSAKKASTSAAAAKKTTTTTKKSTGTTAAKKTSTTAKKPASGTAKKTTTKK